MWLYMLLALVAAYVYYSMVHRRKAYPPGPTPWPLVGNVLQLDQNKMVETIAGWGKQYNGFFTVWLPIPIVFITDFDLMKETIIKQGDLFAGRPEMMSAEIFQKGNYGIIMADGRLWREQRRFALHVLRDFGFGRNIMQEKVMIECRRLVEMIRDEQNSAFDPTHCIEVAVGSIINNLMFDYAFKKNDAKFVNLKQKLDDVLRLSAGAGVLMLETVPWLRHFEFLPLGIKEVRLGFEELLNFLKGEIEEHKKKLNMDEEPADFVSAYLQEMKRRSAAGDTESFFGDWQLLISLSDLWIAGMETTVTTLRWAIAFMLNHPDIQEKVHREIADKIGVENEVNAEDKNRMPYVQATINEIQRCCNLVPINVQRSVSQDVKIRGYTLKKGTWVIPQISAVMSDPAYFKNPEKFDPERFLENGELVKVEQLTPFSLGKRVCLGESLARMELFLIFSTLMQKFKFEPEGGSKPSLQSQPGTVSHVGKYKATAALRND